MIRWQQPSVPLVLTCEICSPKGLHLFYSGNLIYHHLTHPSQSLANFYANALNTEITLSNHRALSFVFYRSFPPLNPFSSGPHRGKTRCVWQIIPVFLQYFLLLPHRSRSPRFYQGIWLLTLKVIFPCFPCDTRRCVLVPKFWPIGWVE